MPGVSWICLASITMDIIIHLRLFHLLDYKIGELNPKAYHITNIVLHLINTLLVFGFVFLLFRKTTPMLLY
ncbi:MAG: hypothetical protein R2764_03585 [Bacteroidales bacterium]